MTLTSHNLRGHLPNLTIIFLAIAIVYGANLTNGFVWDDHATVLGHSIYRTFDLKAMFLSAGNGVEYLPVRDIFYAIDYRLWGEHNAAGFHASNLLIYALTMFSVYFVSLEIIKLLYAEISPALLRRASILTTLVYALHPIQVQSVSFVACRNVLLADLFFFTACLLYLESGKQNTPHQAAFYWCSALCFWFAVMSKATVVIFPLILCGIESFRTSDLQNRLKRTAPFFIISIIYYFVYRFVAINVQVMKQNSANSTAELIGEKIAIAAQIPWFYIRKFIIPSGFAAEYDNIFSRNAIAVPVLLAISGVIVLIWFAWKFRTAYPCITIGIFWFFATLLPVLNFFATNPIVADRYACLPFYGFCLITGTTVVLSAHNSKAPVYAALLCICAISVISFNNIKVWRSDISLWESNIKAAPGLVKGYTNLGWAYFHKRRFDRAFDVFRLEQTLDENSISYDLAQGYHHYLDQNYSEAIRNFKLALQKKPDALYPLYLLARSCMFIGDTEAATVALKNIILSGEIDYSGYRSKARVMLEQLQTGKKLNPRQK